MTIETKQKITELYLTLTDTGINFQSYDSTRTRIGDGIDEWRINGGLREMGIRWG